MRGSVTLNAPSYRPTLVGSSLQGHSLLALLSGKASLAEQAGPDAVSLAPDAGLEPIQTDATRPSSAQARVERDIAQFQQALAAANTPAQLLANPVALLVLLTAHGLADQARNTALATRSLLSNPARSNSLLNQLKDTRWLALNNLLAFATQGLEILRQPETVAAISRSYAEALRVASLAQTPPDASIVHNFPSSAIPSETC
jgi:hypothetical protein